MPKAPASRHLRPQSDPAPLKGLELSVTSHIKALDDPYSPNLQGLELTNSKLGIQ